MITLTNYSMIDSVFDVIRNEACLQFDKGKTLHVEWHYKDEAAITSAQNKALHVWFRQCAKVLNDSGYTCDTVSIINQRTIQSAWTENLFKELIYKPTLAALHDKSSTQVQNSEIIHDVVEALAMTFSNKLQIVLPFFPSKETIMHGLSIGKNN